MYELIKKELVALRFDVNALAGSVHGLSHGEGSASAKRALVEAHAAELASLWAAVAAVETHASTHEADIMDVRAVMDARMGEIVEARSDSLPTLTCVKEYVLDATDIARVETALAL